MVRDKAFTVRVSAEVKAALETAAEQDDRTVASYIERVLTADLVAKGFLKAQPRSSRRRS